MTQLVTRRHAAAMLGVSPATLAKWACLHPTRAPRVVKLGHAARYRLEDVEAVARAGTAVATPTAERAA